MSTSEGGLNGGEVAGKVEAAMARVRAAVPSAQGAPVARSSRARANEAYLFPEDVYRNLHQARTIAGTLSVDYRLGYRTPIIGPAWMRVRERIHQEIRIYIDQMTAHQNTFNAHVLRAVTGLVETIDGLGLRALNHQQAAQGETLAALQAEVRALRAQVDELQARLAGPRST